MHSFTRVVLLVALAGCSVAGTARRSDDSARGKAAGGPASDSLRAEIAVTMQRSAADWNRGDLDAFMASYLDSDRTSFIGRRGVLHGRASIRETYAPRFAPGGVHDSLSFEQLEVDSLAPALVNAIAYYVLARGDSVVARGPTSLVMTRVDGKWLIVHDHSS